MRREPDHSRSPGVHPMTGLAGLVLADARFPGGGHVHSGGVEEAVARGLVTDVDDLAKFLSGRLRTAGLVAAAFAAAAVSAEAFGELDAALDARTPSPAQRAASRAQGRATLRAARLSWPSPVLDVLCAVHPRPHHALLVGAVVGIDGGPPADAARCVAYASVSGPAAAGIRLLGLDPFTVNAVIVGLGDALHDVVDTAVRAAGGPVADLPAPGAPVLDLMAQAHVVHHQEKVRLFAS